jgi:hypothetical protein
MQTSTIQPRGLYRRRRFPLDRIADADPAVREDLCEDAAAPVATHRGLQAWQRFVHALAGCRLAVNDESRVADAKNAAARVCETDAADQQVRAAS